MAIKLIVFDIAGTTVKDNYEVSKTFQYAMKKHGYAIELSAINPLMGYEKKLAIGRLLSVCESDISQITPSLIGSIHADFVREMISFYNVSPDVVALPNVEQTFEKLKKQGIQVAINTGFSRDIANSVIDRLQWREKGLIDEVIGSDEVPLGRPEPFMIQKLMENCGITDPAEVVKVGDTEVDVREGQNAECRYVIGITTGIFTREELASYHPTHIIDDVAQVLDIISQ